MNTSLNNIVNRAEQEALKEMIFKRARERAESLNKEVQDNYTSGMQNDIMDLARATLTPERNPFAKATETKPVVKETEEKAEKDTIGFPPRKQDELRLKAIETNKIYNEHTAAKNIAETMDEARGASSKKQSFMGALNFLNSQATITLVSKKGANFSALA